MSVGPGGLNPSEIFIAPRQEGETAYAYRTRRSLALYGQTPYQRRIFLAQQRGIGLTAARGHATGTRESESQRRNRISREQTGFSVSQLRSMEYRAWLEQNFYTPEMTGMTWTQLMRLAPRLRYMSETTSSGAVVGPDMIREAVELENSYELEKGWAFERLWQKYDDMVAYRMYGDKEPGNVAWGAEYLQVGVFVPGLYPQWWYYH